MKFRIFSLILLMGLAFTIFNQAACTPHAFIASWTPGIDDYLINKQKCMPIWVTISFNQAASSDFVNQFFKHLKYDAIAHKIHKNQFIMTVAHTTTRADVQSMLDRANRQFDPNFKTRKEIELKKALDMANKKALEEKAEAERKAAEKERIAKLAVEAEQRKKEEELQLIEKLKPEAQKALHQGILNDSKLEIKHAVMAGANVDLGIGNQAPIALAIMLGKSKAVDALLENGAKADITFLNQPIVLFALKKGAPEDALSLIKNGASFSGEMDGFDVFNYVSRKLNCVIPGQSRRTDFDLLYEIINRGYNIQENFNNNDLSKNVWFWAIKNNQDNHILFFLNKYPDYWLPYTADVNQILTLPDGSTITAAFLSVQRGDCAQLKHFLNKKTDINKKLKPDGKKLQSLLSYALEIGVEPVVDFLIKHDANLVEAVDIFIKNGGSPYILYSSKFDFPLRVAIAYNNIEAVKNLLSAGAAVNKPLNPLTYVETKIKGCHTPLYYALQNGLGDIIEVLLKHGATL